MGIMLNQSSGNILKCLPGYTDIYMVSSNTDHTPRGTFTTLNNALLMNFATGFYCAKWQDLLANCH